LKSFPIDTPLRHSSDFDATGARQMFSKKPLVLLIDDERPLGNYLLTLLAGAGYEVGLAENGGQCVDSALA